MRTTGYAKPRDAAVAGATSLPGRPGAAAEPTATLRLAVTSEVLCPAAHQAIGQIAPKVPRHLTMKVIVTTQSLPRSGRPLSNFYSSPPDPCFVISLTRRRQNCSICAQVRRCGAPASAANIRQGPNNEMTQCRVDDHRGHRASLEYANQRMSTRLASSAIRLCERTASRVSEAEGHADTPARRGIDGLPAGREWRA